MRVDVSIVVPVFNEEAILHAAVVDLRTRLADWPLRWELWLAENGSRDGTRAVADELAERYPEVRCFSIGAANYGRALREGMARPRGDYGISDEIELCDADLHRAAVAILRGDAAAMVIGSKLMGASRDERPLYRHLTSQIYNGLLQLTLGFPGTDTHGLKAFRRDVVAPIAARCVVDRDVFASELVIRAYREGVRVREVPIRLMEKRPPSIRLWRRVPGVVSRLVTLRRVLGD